MAYEVNEAFVEKIVNYLEDEKNGQLAGYKEGIESVRNAVSEEGFKNIIRDIVKFLPPENQATLLGDGSIKHNDYKTFAQDIARGLHSHKSTCDIIKGERKNKRSEYRHTDNLNSFISTNLGKYYEEQENVASCHNAIMTDINTHFVQRQDVVQNIQGVRFDIVLDKASIQNIDDNVAKQYAAVFSGLIESADSSRHADKRKGLDTFYITAAEFAAATITSRIIESGITEVNATYNVAHYVGSRVADSVKQGVFEYNGQDVFEAAMSEPHTKHRKFNIRESSKSVLDHAIKKHGGELKQEWAKGVEVKREKSDPEQGYHLQ